MKVVLVKNVSKIYKLYDSELKRFLGMFIKFIPYNKKVANDDVSLSINCNESVAILGKNGSGKSTLLKMISGTSYPTSGVIKVKGRVGALLELSSGLEPDLTGRENIYLKARLLNLSNDKISDISEKIIRFSELGEYIDQPVRMYSSGMKTRLGFSISAGLRPNIMIIDEALSVGDAVFRKKCLKLIRKYMNNTNMTLIFVTHSLEQAREFCKRGIVMDNGKVVYDGVIDNAITYYKKMLN